MPEFNLTFNLFDNVLIQLRIFSEDKMRRRRIDDSLLILNLFGAICATRSYLMERRSGAKRDHKCECEIARIWKVASSPWEKIDQEFAERCVINGGCWMDPKAWGDEQVKEMENTVYLVFEETRRLLVE